MRVERHDDRPAGVAGVRGRRREPADLLLGRRERGEQEEREQEGAHAEGPPAGRLSPFGGGGVHSLRAQPTVHWPVLTWPS